MISPILKRSVKNSDDVSDVINTIFRIFYILHKPFTNQSYDDFLNEFDFDILANQEELTKLSEVIAEVFKNIPQKTTQGEV